MVLGLWEMVFVEEILDKQWYYGSLFFINIIFIYTYGVNHRHTVEYGSFPRLDFYLFVLLCFLLLDQKLEGWFSLAFCYNLKGLIYGHFGLWCGLCVQQKLLRGSAPSSVAVSRKSVHVMQTAQLMVKIIWRCDAHHVTVLSKSFSMMSMFF